MAVRAEAARPQLLWEDRGMVVQAEGQVILDEVLAGHPQVEGVPELEFVFHAMHHVQGDGAALRDRLAKEDRVPHLLQHACNVIKQLSQPTTAPVLMFECMEEDLAAASKILVSGTR